MDAATLNDIGITVAGILGIVMFYFIGRSVSRNQAGKNADQGKGLLRKTVTAVPERI